MKLRIALLAFILTPLAVQARDFELVERHGSAVFGPFPAMDGAVVSIHGHEFALKQLPSQDPEAEAEMKRLQDVVLETVQFRQTPLMDVLAHIDHLVQAQDSDRRGIQYIAREAEQSEDASAAFGTENPFDAMGKPGQATKASIPFRLTINLRNVTALEALQTVAECFHMTLEFTGSSIAFVDRRDSLSSLVTRIYPVRHDFMDLVIEEKRDAESSEFVAVGAPKDRGEALKKFTRNAGLPLPLRGSIKHNSASSSLILTATLDQHQIFERILKQWGAIPSMMRSEFAVFAIRKELAEPLAQIVRSPFLLDRHLASGHIEHCTSYSLLTRNGVEATIAQGDLRDSPHAKGEAGDAPTTGVSITALPTVGPDGRTIDVTVDLKHRHPDSPPFQVATAFTAQSGSWELLSESKESEGAWRFLAVRSVIEQPHLTLPTY